MRVKIQGLPIRRPVSRHAFLNYRYDIFLYIQHIYAYEYVHLICVAVELETQRITERLARRQEDWNLCCAAFAPPSLPVVSLRLARRFTDSGSVVVFSDGLCWTHSSHQVVTRTCTPHTHSLHMLTILPSYLAHSFHLC